MAKLRMMIAVFFLTAALAASFGVGPVAATGPDHEVEARLARRTLDADFLRHNVGADLRTVKAGAEVGMALKRRTLDADFLRHNVGADLQTVKAGAEVGMALKRQTLDADFLRHNVGAGFYAANTESTPRRGMQDTDFVRHNVDTPHVNSYQNKR